jgi:hypothetical protein
LTGIPKELFQLWSDYLEPRGYQISNQTVTFPGDIGITISCDA